MSVLVNVLCVCKKNAYSSVVVYKWHLGQVGWWCCSSLLHTYWFSVSLSCQLLSGVEISYCNSRFLHFSFKFCFASCVLKLSLASQILVTWPCYHSLSLVIFFALKSILYLYNYFSFVFISCNIIYVLHTFTFDQLISSYLKWASFRQYVVCFCFFI